MSKRPVITHKHKICVVCEGLEEKCYFNRLLELNVFDSEYEFIPINANGALNMFARFQDAYNNDSYEMVIVFCDTDKYPYKQYKQNIKDKINAFFNKELASQKTVIWANPCTMQIVLAHFGDVHLVTQSKKINAKIIEEHTGVKDYNGHEEQIKEICDKIFRRTYPEMKRRLQAQEYDDNTSGTSNLVWFLEKFESGDTAWINETNQYLES